MHTPDKRKKKVFFTALFLILFALVYIAGNIHTGSLTTWDESYYATLGAEMYKTGHYQTLRHLGKPWFDKPPLYVWATVLSYRMFGINEFSSRLPSALAGVFTVLLVFLLAKEMFSFEAGVFAALLLMGFPHYLHFAKMCTLDSMVTFFITLMILFFWKGRRDHRYMFWAGLMFLPAYMTKGFAAFIALFAIAGYALLAGEMKKVFCREFIAGLVTSLTFITAWHIIQYEYYGGKQIAGYFGQHVFGRSTAVMDGHYGGSNFYQKVLFNKNKPWSVLFYLGFVFACWKALKERNKGALLLAVWSACVFLLFTGVKTKLHWYIMPIYPALAVATGMMLNSLSVWKKIPAALIALLILLLLVAQSTYSWAFKLDLNPDVKQASILAQKLRRDGYQIYLYKISDEKDIFYFRDLVVMCQDNCCIPEGERASAYLIIYDKDRGSLDKNQCGSWQESASFGPIKFLQRQMKGGQ